MFPVRPTNRPCDRVRTNRFDVGIADDQARDFDFVAAEMKYDSTGMFHWTPSRPIEDCILVSHQVTKLEPINVRIVFRF